MDIYDLIAIGISTVSPIFLLLIKGFFEKFVNEKAKNLATLQDVEKITGKVENIKTRFINNSHA